MAYEVVVDPMVLVRLDETVDYVAHRLNSPQAAAKLLDRLDEALALLEQRPLSFPKAQDERLARGGYRRALVGNYVLLFRVAREAAAGEKGLVRVTNLFHGTQDYPGLV